MSSGKSSSSSSSQTQSINEDNRVASEGSGIALGKDAALMIQNEFSDNALAAFNMVISLVRDAGELAIDTSSKVTENAQKSLDTVATALERDNKGSQTAFTDMLPMILIAVVAITIFFFIFRKKG